MSGTALAHCTLEAITQQVDRLKALPKVALHFGDLGVVMTLNSTYSIRVLKDGLYSIWFDKQELSPLTTTINGWHLGRFSH